MTNQLLTLWFEETATKLVIPFLGNPIYEMQKDLARQWAENKKKRMECHYTQLMNWWSRPSIEVILKVETQDTQLSWKTLGDETIMSRAEIGIPYNDTVYTFRGYLRDFEPGSHFNFMVTHTLHNTDKDIGFSVSEANIFLWSDIFPNELLVQL